MIDLSLGKNQAAYELALTQTHLMRVGVTMTDLSGDRPVDLTSKLTDGQVNIDTTADTSRAASLNLDDPDHTLHLDSNSPSDGAVFADRMVQITYGIFVSALNRWVDCPVFTGPVTGMTRDGAEVQLECLGKEYLAKGNLWRPATWRKGADTIGVIRELLKGRAGEKDLVLPDIKHRLRDHYSLGRMDTAWGGAQTLAAALDRQLYYDGAGVCRLRSFPNRSTYTFKQGVNVLSLPQLGYDVSSVINAVYVTGATPKGKHKHPVHGSAVAPASHPLSPWKLGRQGGPRYLVSEVSNDKIKSSHDCDAMAKRLLGHALREAVTASFDALPAPHLDPYDVVNLSTDSSSVTFALKQASIPLVHSGVMSVGSVRNVTPAWDTLRRGKHTKGRHHR